MIVAREGDFIETTEKLIFDVKGLVHPKDHVIAFLRYFPDPGGSRLRNGISYKKVYALDERYKIIKKKFPHYLYQDQRIKDMTLQAVPHEYIRKIHQPQEYLLKVIKTPEHPHEEILKDFVLILQKASRIPQTAIGISGSFLVGLFTPQSDLDLIIYGSQNGRKVYEGIAKLFQTLNSLIRPYRKEELRQLWEFRVRDTYLSFEEFMRFEQRKRLQGKFDVGTGFDFYIRVIKDWKEVTESYEEDCYIPLGTALVEGMILSDEEALLTPCRYPIAESRLRMIDSKSSILKLSSTIREVISYRGRFCEARKGEVIQAQGTLEWVENLQGDSHLRLIVGNHKQDFLKIVSTDDY